MARLIEAEAALIQAGRGQHPDGTGNHACLVGQDIAEHVLCQNDVKLFRIADQLHRAVVHQHIFQLHIRIVSGHLRGDLSPVPGGIQDIGLVYLCYLLSPLPGNLKCASGDSADLVFIVAQSIHGGRHAVDLFCFSLPEIKAAGKLPHNNQIKALISDDVITERTCRAKFVVQVSRPEIGKKPQCLPDSQQSRLRTFGGLQLIPR